MKKKLGTRVGDYKWNRYMWVEPIRIGQVHLRARQTFGLRSSRSKPIKTRLVLDQTGLGHVYTIDSKMTDLLLKRSQTREAPKILAYDRLTEQGRRWLKSFQSVKSADYTGFWRLVRAINFPARSQSDFKVQAKEVRAVLNLVFEREQINAFAVCGRTLADHLKRSIENFESERQLFTGGRQS